MLTHVEKIVVSFRKLGQPERKSFSENYNVLTTMDEIKLWKLTNFENYFSWRKQHTFLIRTWYMLDLLAFNIHLTAENLVLEHEATKIGRIPFLCKSLQYFVFFCLFIVLKAFSRHGAWIMCKNGGSNNDCLYFSFNPLTPGNSLDPLSFRLPGHALIIWVFSTG